ncbi:hypothetical protein CEE45_08780 [Candidatus Heimdallarchaeota archaeon B3_Heim]|nr:MAG: hypothetical protein CEE45_08780 [Candidatus Heimdallarchaeota archaeon B3_Heim]
MTDSNDQLKLYYEQQRKLIDQIKTMRKELDQEQKLTTRYRKQRDRYKEERQSLLQKTTPDVEGRDSKKELLEGLKKRRDFLRRQAQRKEGAPFKLLTNVELEKLTIVELKFHLYELEFKQQTSSLDREEEGLLIDEIRRIEERVVLLEKRNEAIVADYLGDIPKSKERIQEEISSIEQKISEEENLRKDVQTKIQKLYTRIGPLKEEEDKAHQEFVDHLQRVEELKEVVQAKQEELDSLKAKISQVKKKLKIESQQETFGKIEERIQGLIEKRDGGQVLSPEEQEFLMSYGHVPF